MAKIIKETIHANGFDISLFTEDLKNSYISLTDIAKYRSDEPNDVIKNWLRNKDTIAFLGLWESLHNPDFKPIEFDGFRNEAGSNAFTMSPTKWIEGVNAKGIISKAGRYGGTFAHSYSDINYLLVLANLESYNAILIEQNIPQAKRLEMLRSTAEKQLKTILGLDFSSTKLLTEAGE